MNERLPGVVRMRVYAVSTALREQWQVGSLTGAVASQRVPEARDGGLKLVGNQLLSAMAQARLTARATARAETKVGHSDSVVARGRAIAQRIKGTLVVKIRQTSPA